MAELAAAQPVLREASLAGSKACMRCVVPHLPWLLSRCIGLQPGAADAPVLLPGGLVTSDF